MIARACVTVENDPRSPATTAELRAQHELQMKIYGGIQEAWDGYHQVAAMRARVAELGGSTPPSEVTQAAKALDSTLAELAGSTEGGAVADLVVAARRLRLRTSSA